MRSNAASQLRLYEGRAIGSALFYQIQTTGRNAQNSYKIPISFPFVPSRSFMRFGAILMMKSRPAGKLIACPAGSFHVRFPPRVQADGQPPNRSTAMMDLVLIGTGILFFALSVAYIKACDAL